MTFPEVGYTAGSDEHDTPIGFFAPIAEQFDGFDLDPCASSTSDLADVNFRKEDDGLSREWFGDVFLNPPYSDVSLWLEETIKRLDHGQPDRVVALIFARTSTKWFHNYIPSADLVCFVEGRLAFGGAGNSAPAPSLVAVWGDYPDPLVDVLERGPGDARGGLVTTFGGSDP